MRSGLGRTGVPAERQPQHEAGPAPGRRARLEAAPVLAGDPPADREPEAGSVPGRLAGVEGLEDAGERLRGDSGPVVAALDLHAVALPAAGNPDGPAPSFERFDRVLEQVEEDLVERPGVALDARQIGPELEAQLHPGLPEAVAEQLRRR